MFSLMLYEPGPSFFDFSTIFPRLNSLQVFGQNLSNPDPSVYIPRRDFFSFIYDSRGDWML